MNLVAGALLTCMHLSIRTSCWFDLVHPIPCHGASLVNWSILAILTGLDLNCSLPLQPRHFLVPSLLCQRAPRSRLLHLCYGSGQSGPGVSSYDQDKCPSLSSDPFLLRENGQRAQDQGKMPGTEALRQGRDPQEEATCWR